MPCRHVSRNSGKPFRLNKFARSIASWNAIPSRMARFSATSGIRFSEDGPRHPAYRCLPGSLKASCRWCVFQQCMQIPILMLDDGLPVFSRGCLGSCGRKHPGHPHQSSRRFFRKTIHQKRANGFRRVPSVSGTHCSLSSIFSASMRAEDQMIARTRQSHIQEADQLRIFSFFLLIGQFFPSGCLQAGSLRSTLSP